MTVGECESSFELAHCLEKEGKVIARKSLSCNKHGSAFPNNHTGHGLSALQCTTWYLPNQQASQLSRPEQ